MGDLTQLTRGPGGGTLGRALKLITLSLILAVFAAFAAHHAESLFNASHTDAPVTQAAAAVEEAPVAGTLAQGTFITNTDVLQIVGFGCAALLLCGLFGALLRVGAASETPRPKPGERIGRTVAMLAAVTSRIAPSPSLAQLSISRT